MTRAALVTGAAGQIGSRVAILLREDGYDVRGLDLPSALDGADPALLGCDLADEAAVRDTVAAAVDELGGLDLLVHAAGLSAIGAFEDHDLAVHRKVMEATHFGAVAVTMAALPALRLRRGRIVLIGSVAGFAPVLGRPAYVAAKHAVTGLFTALRPELAEQGVAVTIAHPTFVVGGMTEAAPRATGAERATSGAELTADDVAREVVEGVRRGQDLVLVGRTARASYLLSRHAPGLYLALMKRRLARSHGGVR